MKNLIDRGTGEEICEISDTDFYTLAGILVRESETSSGYYLNAESLKLLDEAEICPQVVRALKAHVDPPGLDFGWENQLRTDGPDFHGTVRNGSGVPLGGIRVALLSRSHRVLNWAYSRSNGAYHVTCPAEATPQYARFAGRGDLVVAEHAIEKEGDQGSTLVDTLSGSVVSAGGLPISDVSVQLLSWREANEAEFHQIGSMGGGLTWGDTDGSGRFVIPVCIENRKIAWQAALEIIAPKGQTLRKLIVTVHPEQSLEIGELLSPEPSLEWGGEPVQGKPSVVMYPGVSERPLS